MLPLKTIQIDLSHIQKGLELFIDIDKENALYINEESESNEAKYQLVEGNYYDYTFSDSNFRLQCSNQKNIVSQRKRDQHAGVISPNIFVGTLLLEISHCQDATIIGDIELEVQSVKASYREDYRFMLNEIAEKCTDLILQANSPVSHTFESNPDADNETLYQRFAFIKSMIESEDFENAMQRIISSPSTNWQNYEELVDVRSVKKFTSKNVRQLLRSPNKMKLNTSHSLFKRGVKSIATKIETNNKKESLDTAENRFIKHALQTFSQFCEDIESHKNAGKRLKSEAKNVTRLLDNHLQHTFFKSIEKPTTLKLNSPILQRKEGYRQLLKTWLNFDLAARLIWQGGNDVYKGGKKDIATLYEYWLFFKLLTLLEKIFHVKSKDLEELIKPSKDGLSLQLRQGSFKAIEGTYTQGKRELTIRFNYNKSFDGNTDLDKSGSWTTTLRPDYTLSIWPQELSDKEAEKQEQIVHIHFDAKYKIANINHIIEAKNENELNEEKKENLAGVYKNADLLKMHAYKDAIRRTAGAYVLYPGDKQKKLKGFHEVLPGLGAFPISPSIGEDNTTSLEVFLNEVLNHFMNRANQRENISAKTYEITKEKNSLPLNESIPEYLDGKKLIPDETYVIVGYVKSEKRKQRMEWYLKNEMYNFRMNDSVGGIQFTEKEAKAKFLLLRESSSNEATKLYKLKPGIRVFTGKKLEEMGHPGASKKAYLIVEFEKEILPEFLNFTFRFQETKEYLELSKKHKNKQELAGIPFTTALTNLMAKNKNE